MVIGGILRRKVSDVDDVPSIGTKGQVAFVVLEFRFVVGEHEDMWWFDAHGMRCIFAYKYHAVEELLDDAVYVIHCVDTGAWNVKNDNLFQVVTAENVCGFGDVGTVCLSSAH